MIRFLHRRFASGRSLRGGLFLPTIGRAVDRSPVLPYPCPANLRVPLRSGDSPEARPVLAAGREVQAGQLIARADKPGGLNVHAPVKGRIREWARADTARRADVPAALIETAEDQSVAPLGTIPRTAEIPEDWQPSGLPEVAAAARYCGLTDLQSTSRSLGDELERAGGKPPEHLIINTLPGEPLASQAHLEIQPSLLVRVADWLGSALSARRVWIAVDRSDARVFRRLRAAVRGTRIRVAAVVNKYPQHAPVLLTSTMTGRETPPGRHTLEVGVFVMQAEALAHLAAAMPWPSHEPVPLTHRVVTVAGPAVLRPGRYWVPIGTSFSDLLCHVGLRDTPKRVIEGGPLTGQAVAHLDVVTTKATSALLVLDQAADRVPAPGPCVRCGWCQEDCPVGLDPQMLLNLAEQEDPARAAAFFPEACIECGVCSYVCPAELPLATAAARLRQLARGESKSREADPEH